MSYEEIAVINDPDGPSVRITKRKNKNGLTNYSYSFFRTYMHDGTEKTTTWFSARHIPAIVRLTSAVDERLKLERNRTSRQFAT